MSVPKVCVIGAGPAGLSTLIQLKLRQEEGLGPFNVTCYESQPTWGGIWNLTWRTGIWKSGLGFTKLYYQVPLFKILSYL